MAARPTVLVKKAGVYYKLCKLWMGSDGSFYMTVPYHPARKAMITKLTVNYDAEGPQFSPMENALEVAVLDDEDARLKMSYHPDGACQFSGDGILSGLENGQFKGVGVHSSPLPCVRRGPAFILALQGLEAFEQSDRPKSSDITFLYEDLNATSEMTGLVFEVQYFQPLHRRFIRTSAETGKYIFVDHPCGIAFPLRVLFPPDDCRLPGFLGVELYAMPPLFSGATAFTLNGPGENIRIDERGHKIGDLIYAFFPAPANVPYRRDLRYNPEGPA